MDFISRSLISFFAAIGGMELFVGRTSGSPSDGSDTDWSAVRSPELEFHPPHISPIDFT
jgi:hypothetical protein